MGVTDKIWGALTSIIKLEDKLNRQSDAMKTQQTKIEDLTGRVIRLETQLDMLMQAASINEQPRSKLRGIEHPSLNSFRGKPRGIEPGGIERLNVQSP